uniref:Uncharacterized protein n=1 Tax=Candidatus Kentrum sp. UNK TaxID=2126344 RepID=A0A451AXD8_9GAMM|nr:MAG: hypothetical protein BECKUNK1418G_GA0071005_102916 [Candidatus Kentron sp. UNK]VFK70715.1 MAG: hypothetical protein BECKUNK1418H_GA0071006_103616 [Candidatus Kentron sp. UNK]
MQELEKAEKEIRLHQHQEDDWFHNKFLLIGVLVLGFAMNILTPYSNASNSSNTSIDRIRRKIFSSGTTCLMLAIACVISLLMDAHIRAHVSKATQAGLWIKHYVEKPIISQDEELCIDRNKGKDCLKGWETFLYKDGMHSDPSYRVTWHNSHALSWLIYIIYMALLFNVWKSKPYDRSVLFFGFVLVHVTLVGFAWMGHSFPSTLDNSINNLIPISTPVSSGTLAISAASLLIILNLFCLYWSSEASPRTDKT